MSSYIDEDVQTMAIDLHDHAVDYLKSKAKTRILQGLRFAKASYACGLKDAANLVGQALEKLKLFDEAARWYARGVKEGVDLCLHNLAYLHYCQRLTRSHLKTARELFQRSAEKGFPESMFMLGLMYEQGQGTKSDLEQARFWYQQGADAGDIQSMSNLGGLLYFELNSLRDGLELLQMAADHGDMKARKNLIRIAKQKTA